jgi:Ca2+-binding RTX toxin-like protein
LLGNAGNDPLAGGAGNDVFLLNALVGRDTHPALTAASFVVVV